MSPDAPLVEKPPGTLASRIRRALVRETSSGSFIPEVDGLRFVAIMSVVLYHLSQFYMVKTGRREGDIATLVLSQGGFGVSLFFVISGFIISLPFAKSFLVGGTAPALAGYYFRRLTRLEPPYFANLLVMFTLLTILKPEPMLARLPHLLASAIYQHGLVYGTASSVNFVAWSLEVEFQFYALAPFLVRVFAIQSEIRRRMLIVTMILTASAVALAVERSPRLHLSIFGHGGYFLAGFLLADLYVTRWSAADPRREWDVVTLLAWPGILLVLLRGAMWRLFLPLLVAIAYAAAFRGQWTRRLFRLPVLYVVGGMCYTTYLYHFAILSALGNPLLPVIPNSVAVSMSVGVLGLMVIPAILAVSALLYLAFEKPFMRRNWPQRARSYWSMRRASALAGKP